MKTQQLAATRALADGLIGEVQAWIIAAAIGELPEGTTAEQVQASEDTLVGDAPEHSLKDLRSRSKRIADQFKPEPEVDEASPDGQIEHQAPDTRIWVHNHRWRP